MVHKRLKVKRVKGQPFRGWPKENQRIILVIAQGLGNQINTSSSFMLPFMVGEKIAFRRIFSRTSFSYPFP